MRTLEDGAVQLSRNSMLYNHVYDSVARNNPSDPFYMPGEFYGPLPWPWLIYSDKMRLGNSVLVHSVSVVSPLAVAIFARHSVKQPVVLKPVLNKPPKGFG